MKKSPGADAGQADKDEVANVKDERENGDVVEELLAVPQVTLFQTLQKPLVSMQTVFYQFAQLTTT